MNKIEQIEDDINYFEGVLCDHKRDRPHATVHNKRLQRLINSHKQALKIEKGDVYLASWKKDGIKLPDYDENVQVAYGYNSYTTIIPKPKEIEDE